MSSSVQNSEGGGEGNGGDSFADPCQEFKQGFLGVSSGLPLNFKKICLLIAFQQSLSSGQKPTDCRRY